MTPEQAAAMERVANEQIAAAIDLLCKVPTKSTAHMSTEERRDGLGVMLADLFTLARKDGCIAAAWAYEFACSVAPKLDAFIAERDDREIDEAALKEFGYVEVLRTQHIVRYEIDHGPKCFSHATIRDHGIEVYVNGRIGCAQIDDPTRVQLLRLLSALQITVSPAGGA